MGLISAKIVFTCPETGKEITLRKCVDADGKGGSCPKYKFWGSRGIEMLIGCEAAK